MKPSDTLVIAEKHSLAVDIADALAKPYVEQKGAGFITSDTMTITWESGHLLGLVDAEAYDARYAKWVLDDLPILPEPFTKDVIRKKKTRTIDKGAERQLAIVQRLLKKAKLVVHAGDPDREGQIIVDEVLEQFGYRGAVKRLWLNAQTTSGIREAYAAMRDNSTYANLSNAAQAREQLDWLVGINGTRGYTKLWNAKGHQGLLNVGRVKSVVVGLVDTREDEIEKFIRTAYFSITARLGTAGGVFDGNWRRPSDAGPPTYDADGRLLDRKVAEAIKLKCQGRDGVISKADTSKGLRTAPPLLFSLGELQKLANKIGFSPDSTLEAAQALYSTYKLTTYPRTSCQFAPEAMWQKAPDIIAAAKKNFGAHWTFGDGADSRRKSAAFNDKKLDAHFAIIPTGDLVDVSRLPDRERIIYTEIVKRFLSQFHGDYVYNSTTVEVVVSNETFEQRGIVPVELGWRSLYKSAAADPKQQVIALPPVKVGDTAHAEQILVEDKQTSPPPRFNGASLLDAMEHIDQFVTDPAVKKTLKACGLGTDATRGPTIKELVDAHFFDEVQDGKTKVYVPTPKARAYARSLPTDLIRPDFTAWLEDKLGDVARGTLTRPEFSVFARKFVEKLVTGMKDGSVAQIMPTPADLPPEVVVRRTRGGKSGSGAKTRSSGTKTRAGGQAGGTKRPVSRQQTDLSPAAAPSRPTGNAFALHEAKGAAPSSVAAPKAQPTGNPFKLSR